MSVKHLVSEFAQFDTPSVSDAMDKLGAPGGLLGIKSVVAGTVIDGVCRDISEGGLPFSADGGKK